ncbi:MAG: hypothetical protein HWD60_19925 [Defluviicoccus sp.]|nr:MAG: hypothetical protein HWD60_19925 [Defluviicoccus sp.]
MRATPANRKKHRKCHASEYAFGYSDLRGLAEANMADDNDQELAYYEQLLNDIRDIKARVWNFITILVVITGGVLAIDNNDLNDIRELLGFVIIIAASATFFISIDSFIKLGDVRKNSIIF